MRQDDIINGYRILQDFTCAGGGLSKWTFAEKGGKEFFIKEFLHPTFPLASSPGSEKMKARKRKSCEIFEAHHSSLKDAIDSSHIPGGNLIATLDFFRHGAKYFKVTEKVDVTTLKPAQLGNLPLSQRILIMTTVAHSLRILHRLDIVHGDLKLDNVLIKKTRMGSYTTKLIDFDNSYFSGRPPEMAEDVVGDMVFYSPELASYIRQDASATAEHLTAKSDIYALGLLYSLYLTGKLPNFDKAKYKYAWIASHSDIELKLSDGDDEIPDELEGLLNSMMVFKPEDRPDIDHVFENLKKLIKRPEMPATPPANPSPKSKLSRTSKDDSPLKGKMMGKSGEVKPPVPPESEPLVPEKKTPPPIDEDDSSKLKGTLLRKKD